MLNCKEARVYAVSISRTKGIIKENVSHADLVAGQGIKGDAHCYTRRPISLLPLESFAKVEHPALSLHPGVFAENITTEGLDLMNVVKGDRFQIGRNSVIEVLQVGKECHDMCEIGVTVGKCIMPEEGVFAKVISGGRVKPGDRIKRIESD